MYGIDEKHLGHLSAFNLYDHTYAKRKHIDCMNFTL